MGRISGETGVEIVGVEGVAQTEREEVSGKKFQRKF